MLSAALKLGIKTSMKDPGVSCKGAIWVIKTLIDYFGSHSEWGEVYMHV